MPSAAPTTIALLVVRFGQAALAAMYAVWFSAAGVRLPVIHQGPLTLPVWGGVRIAGVAHCIAPRISARMVSGGMPRTAALVQFSQPRVHSMIQSASAIVTWPSPL